MNPITEELKRMFRPTFAWLAIAGAVCLSIIGIAAIGGTSEPFQAPRQGFWLIISLVVMLFLMLPHPRLIGLASYTMLGLTIALLLVLIIPGVPGWLVPVRNNARCWINLHFMNLQPSELAKIAFVLSLAWYLRFRQNYRTLLGLLPPFAIMFVPVILILKEPDLGSALVFAPAMFFVLVAAGAKIKHMLSLVAIGAMFVAINVAVIYTLPEEFQLLKPYQQRRITQFVDQEGYQQKMAMTLLGSGGVAGYGEDRSKVIVRYNHLPEDHNDMIFAVIVNRWGLLGGAATIGLYALVVVSFLIVAGQAKDPFARLTSVGFAGVIFWQASTNMAMTLGILPITGITLPFVSYGGSSLLATFMMVGLVANFATRPPQMLSRPSFEYDNPDVIFQ